MWSGWRISEALIRPKVTLILGSRGQVCFGANTQKTVVPTVGTAHLCPAWLFQDMNPCPDQEFGREVFEFATSKGGLCLTITTLHWCSPSFTTPPSAKWIVTPWKGRGAQREIILGCVKIGHRCVVLRAPKPRFLHPPKAQSRAWGCTSTRARMRTHTRTHRFSLYFFFLAKK